MIGYASETPIKTYNNVASMGATTIIMINTTYIIDLFRGACAVKGNVQVAGHVKRVDHGAVFYA